MKLVEFLKNSDWESIRKICTALYPNDDIDLVYNIYQKLSELGIVGNDYLIDIVREIGAEGTKVGNVTCYSKTIGRSIFGFDWEECLGMEVSRRTQFSMSCDEIITHFIIDKAYSDNIEEEECDEQNISGSFKGGHLQHFVTFDQLKEEVLGKKSTFKRRRYEMQLKLSLWKKALIGFIRRLYIYQNWDLNMAVILDLSTKIKRAEYGTGT